MATGLDIVDLLTRVGVNYSEVDVAAHSWRRRQLATLLPSSPASDPAMTMPQVFLSSSTHIGGNEELRAFHDSGELRRSLEELKGAQTPEFPPPFLEPSKEEPSAVQTYAPGASGPKGSGDLKDQLYCQVALTTDSTFFVDDPSAVPGLEENEDYVKFGYGYYIGAPWRQRGGRWLTGTVAVMEKEKGKLRKEHIGIVELFRDLFEQDVSSL
ncbi:hypothetical protein TrLO_g12002 [Triparma laevis f. longispina]|uniref:Uncharacterized protein n=1 Tax=Triparma laevis f. longispina TaxID=1714387 RepID=A0A9W7F899_9STRA|nr:hypothetical protein TrLO_g12002 [Triparma laevis f. longispina]